MSEEYREELNINGDGSETKRSAGKIPWKIIIPVVCVAVAAAVLIFVNAIKGGFYIYTESSGSFIFSGKASFYYVTGIPSLKYKVSSDSLKERIKGAEKEKDEAKEEAYFVVTGADPDAYRNGKFDENYDLVFVYGDSIYYHGQDRKDVFYEYSRTDGQIREIAISPTLANAIGTDKTMRENIAVLSLLSIYPEIEKQFNKRKGIVWNAFYDEKTGRVFYEQGEKLYEYLPESGKSRLAYSAGKTENIRAIYTK